MSTTTPISMSPERAALTAEAAAMSETEMEPRADKLVRKPGKVTDDEFLGFPKIICGPICASR